jgi:hypothetical protein
MKALLTFAAVVCFTAMPAFSADGQVSQSSLTRLGLGGLTPISDTEGLEIRGQGLMDAMGMNNDGYGDQMHKDHDKNKHDKNKHDEHKHHEQKHHEQNHHEKHDNHFKCDFHPPKPNCNIGSLCHTHCGKAG